MTTGGTRVRRHLWVKGVVQGVNFRNAAKQVAEQLGIVGWVKNLDDGRVEALIEGAPDQVAQMVGWFKRGPPAARVEELTVQPESSASVLLRFQVVR